MSYSFFLIDVFFTFLHQTTQTVFHLNVRISRKFKKMCICLEGLDIVMLSINIVARSQHFSVLIYE